MTLVFAMLAGLILGSAFAAMALRRLVHCVLCLTLTFAGLAALFLQLGAEFVGFAQILVYVGAVAVLIVFTLLLTRNSERAADVSIGSSSWLVGIVIAVMVLGCLVIGILSSSLSPSIPAPPSASVKNIGQRLMTDDVVPLEVAGLLLTAAVIGAAVIAMPEKKEP